MLQLKSYSTRIIIQKFINPKFLMTCLLLQNNVGMYVTILYTRERCDFYMKNDKQFRI